MSLAKYQVKALASEVRNKFNKRKEQVKQTSEFQHKYEEIAGDVMHKVDYSNVAEMIEEFDELQDRVSELRSNIKSSVNELNNIVGQKLYSSTTSLSKIDNAIDRYATKKALMEIGFSEPSGSEIRDAVIVADLSNSEDVIKTVVDRLSNQESG